MQAASSTRALSSIRGGLLHARLAAPSPRRPAARTRRSLAMAAAASPVYVVLVTGKVKPGRIEEFKSYFKPLADHVAAHEDGALSYQLSVGEQDPDALCIFERYTSKAYLEEVHWQSEPFKTFGAKVRAADLWVEKTVTKYWEEPPGAYGFVTK